MKLKVKDLFSQQEKTANSSRSLTFAFAPLEPYTANPILRELMGHHGAQILVRPKILPQHLLKAKKWQEFEKIKGLNKLRTPEGKPIFDGIQLIARPEDPIKPAVKYLNNYSNQLGINFIDLNFCCPGYKVLPQKRGGELLKNPDLVIKVIDQVLKYSDLPVSCKIRKGYLMNDTPIDLCKKISREFGKNIAWIAINRAPVKMANVNMDDILSDITSFTQAVESVDGNVPIIANGGIDSRQLVDSLKEHTQVSGVMIGRAALGNQSIFSTFSPNFIQSNNFTSENLSEKNLEELFNIIHKYNTPQISRWTTLGQMKRLLYHFIKYFYISQFKQLPQGYGFSQWNQTNFTVNSFIDALAQAVPSIEKLQWKNWLEYLIESKFTT